MGFRSTLKELGRVYNTEGFSGIQDYFLMLRQQYPFINPKTNLINTKYLGPVAYREGTTDLAVLYEQLTSGVYMFPSKFINYLKTKPSKVVKIIDLGSCIGTSALYMTLQLNRLGHTSDLVGFEPSLDNYHMALLNSQLAGSQHPSTIKFYNQAVGVTGGFGSFTNPNGSRDTWSGRFSPDKQGTIQRVALNGVFESFGIPDVLKVDIEGGEYPLIPKLAENSSITNGALKLIFVEKHDRLGLGDFDLCQKSLENSGFVVNKCYAPNSPEDLCFLHKSVLNIS